MLRVDTTSKTTPVHPRGTLVDQLLREPRVVSRTKVHVLVRAVFEAVGLAIANVQGLSHNKLTKGQRSSKFDLALH